MKKNLVLMLLVLKKFTMCYYFVPKFTFLNKQYKNSSQQHYELQVQALMDTYYFCKTYYKHITKICLAELIKQKQKSGMKKRPFKSTHISFSLIKISLLIFP